MPVVTIAPNDALLEKLKSNLQEVRARGGELFVFADADTRIDNGEGLHVIRMPEHYGALSAPSCTWCRCSCWRITRPVRGGRMWTSPETWPSRSRLNDRERLREVAGGLSIGGYRPKAVRPLGDFAAAKPTIKLPN